MKPQNDNIEPVKKKFSLKGVFKKAAQKTKSLGKIFAHTAKDLRKTKEIGILAAAVVIPGGFIAYGAYRLQQHRKKMKEQDAAPAAETPALPPAETQKPPAEKKRQP